MAVLWQTFNQWKEYGTKQGYDKRNPANIKESKSKEERSWYIKGRREGWLEDFSFNRKHNVLTFQSFEQWRDYGKEKGYDKKNSVSVSKSKNKSERSWYAKGCKKRWIENFQFKIIRETSNLKFESLKQWRDYGLEHNYEQRNPNSLSKSKDKDERAWYNKGQREKWLSKFKFKKVMEKSGLIFKTFDEWYSYGMQHGYNKRNPASISDSEDKKERAWYNLGSIERWIPDFPFKRIRKHNKLIFKNIKEWKDYGIKQGYDKRNPVSISKSEDEDERYWYNKGSYKGWLSKFKFKKIKEECGLIFKTFDEWYSYGIEHGYGGRNPASIWGSEDKKERSWYTKGVREKWLAYFKFKRKKRNSLSSGKELEALLEGYAGG